MMRAYNVFLIEERDIGGGTAFTKTLIDTVFFQPGDSCPIIKRSLVDHDGYPPNIYVQRRPQ